MFIIEDFELLETTKIIQMMFVVKTLLPRLLFIKDVARDVFARRCCYQGVSTKGCCYQRTANVDTKNIVAKGHYCTPKMLLPN